MASYIAPSISDLGSLAEMTLQLPGGNIGKSGGGSDVLTALTGLGGTITITPNVS
ncbi:hypothetical protein ACNHUS_07030 [Actinomycetes bacterium M1A6_2h]